MEIIKEKNQKANKPHLCCFCEGIIEIGELYNNQLNKDDGEIYTWKTHLKCDSIAFKLDMYDDCSEGLTGDAFQDCINEAFEEEITFEEKLKYLIDKFEFR